MPDIIQDKIALGNVLKTLRMSKDLTVEQVARQSGVTKGSISLIENGKRSPSPIMLKNLLAVYGESLGTFFSKVKEKRRRILYRAKNATVITGKPGGAVCAELLVPVIQENDIELIKVTLKEEGKLDQSFSHKGVEYGYLLRGEITLAIEKKKLTIQRGDSFCYTADQPHTILNTGSEPAEILFVVAPRRE
jgi:transcriptional regulator with XRE-family HTH domain